MDNDRFLLRVRAFHPFVSHPLFNRHTNRYDLLHMIDHHGVASHTIANILWAHLSFERESEVLPGANMSERLAFLNSDIAAYYQHAKVANRLPALKEDNIKADSHPELMGQCCESCQHEVVVPHTSRSSCNKPLQPIQRRSTTT